MWLCNCTLAVSDESRGATALGCGDCFLGASTIFSHCLVVSKLLELWNLIQIDTWLCKAIFSPLCPKYSCLTFWINLLKRNLIIRSLSQYLQLRGPWNDFLCIAFKTCAFLPVYYIRIHSSPFCKYRSYICKLDSGIFPPTTYFQASPLPASRGSAPTAFTSFLAARASSRIGIKETPMIAKITCRQRHLSSTLWQRSFLQACHSWLFPRLDWYLHKDASK